MWFATLQEELFSSDGHRTNHLGVNAAMIVKNSRCSKSEVVSFAWTYTTGKYSCIT
jgi:hypothetical protein